MTGDLNTTILIVGFAVTIGSNTAVSLHLSGRIDKISSDLGGKIDGLRDKLDLINKTLGAHGEAIDTL